MTFLIVLAVLFVSQQKLDCESSSMPAILCSSILDPPEIAVLLGGSARTFVRLLVHRSLQENVLNAFGAPTTLFAYVKTRDARGAQVDARAGTTLHSSRRAVEDTLRRLGVFDSSQYFIDDDDHPALGPNCSRYTRPFPEDNRLESLVGQLAVRLGCYRLLQAYEKKALTQFTWILYARPDLLWYRPVPPWCAMSLAVAEGVYVRDWVFMFLRMRAAEVLVVPHHRFYSCTAPPINARYDIELWEQRYVQGRRTRKPRYTIHSTGILPAVLLRDERPEFEQMEMEWWFFPGANVGDMLNKDYAIRRAEVVPDLHLKMGARNQCHRESQEL